MRVWESVQWARDPRHVRVVEGLRKAYAEVPAGERVRLAKTYLQPVPVRRRPAPGAGRDAGSTGCSRSTRTPARPTCRAWSTYETAGRRDPGPRADAAGGAAAEDHHARRRGGRPRHRVLARSATACRTSRCASWRCSPATAGSSWPGRTTSTPTCSARFPNSYGTLGYTLRLHHRPGAGQAVRAAAPPAVRHRRGVPRRDGARSAPTRAYEGEPVDFVDGTVFAAGRAVPDPGHVRRRRRRRSATTPGWTSTTGRSSGATVDYLTVRDYLWRWDTDWFWCSRAFGVQQPLVRRLWPRRYRRSDVYRRLVAFDRRHRLTARVARLRGQPAGGGGRPGRRGAGRADGEVPRRVPPRRRHQPVWLCPLRLRADHAWPLYPLEPDELYVNVGFWSSVAAAAGPGRRALQPPGRGGGQRAGRAQVAVLHRALLGGGVLAALQRRRRTTP